MPSQENPFRIIDAPPRPEQSSRGGPHFKLPIVDSLASTMPPAAKPATAPPPETAPIRESDSLLAHVTSRAMAAGMNLLLGSFPATVRIETTSRCNAACTFCPRDTMNRPKETMDDELFEKIVRECAAAKCKLLHLHNFGEPLLDKALPDRIALAKKLGIRRVKLFSNGSLLKDETARRLLHSGLDEIKISIDGASATEFNELRIGLSHEKVIENVRRFKAMRDAADLQGSLRIIATCTQTSNREETDQLLSNMVDRIDYTRLHNWAGALGSLVNRRIRKPCDRLWRTFTVLANGNVSICCRDYAGRELVGNVRQQTIREIWRNHRYYDLRRLHAQSKQRDIDVCSDCSSSFW
ncbi:MAG: radical SAM protein [Pirellulales bacterium]|nr:radical SAM protein [Pirellulales bacterium]